MISIWRQPGMRPLVVMTFLGFCGYAVLLPVAPLWAVAGGADTGESGLVNGVLLLFTVLTQLFVPRALRRLGWGPTLVVGMVLLGVPAALLAVSDALGPVLALSAARGVGFGVLTVTGSSAVAALVGTERRGEAIGVYGLAVALPNLVLLPAGPWLAENAGFGVVFAISALPLLAVPAALRLASTLHHTAPDLLAAGGGDADPGDPASTAYRRLLRPTLLLLSVTLAGGAVLTFAPQMVSGTTATAGLFLMGLVAALGRWRAGMLADRYGPQRFLWPLVLLTGLGTALVAWSVAEPVEPLVFLVAMVVVGLAYGGLQNLTLVVAFGAVSRRHHHLASAVWNVGFDAGTALGSVAVGAIAVQASFSSAFWLVACLTVAVLPVALRSPSGAR
ncbi:MFS transporter [Nocardioides dongxiaopingii]|uniref:MFS transporter n=1 Tax=Nocardioides sp. S-1144 TaxID=2582905 RepID=UPI001C9E51FD|nr:MFS transporter [Nocardioides sp. S-1144]